MQMEKKSLVIWHSRTILLAQQLLSNPLVSRLKAISRRAFCCSSVRDFKNESLNIKSDLTFEISFRNIENTRSKRTTSRDISEGHTLVNSCLISDELMEAENLIDAILEDGFVGRQINELKAQCSKRNRENVFIGVIV